MKSPKWWTAIPVALVAMCAFAAPAMATNHYGLEQEGKPLALKTVWQVNGTTPFVLKSSKVTLTCSKASLSMYVAGNNGGTEATSFLSGGTAASQISGCKNNSGSVLPVSSVEVREFKQTGPTSASMNFAMTSETTPGGLVCTWSSSSLSWTLKPGTSALTLNSSPVTASPLACGSGWSVSLGSGSATSGGKAVIVN